MTRFLLSRQTGLDTTAPYWRGERAEQIVDARVAAYPVRVRGSRTTGGTPVVRSANAELRRLERALKRRKTVAARLRIQQRIDALKSEAATHA